MKIRIRWSDVEVRKPIRVVWTDFNNCRFYQGTRFVLLDAMITFGEEKRDCEMCLPYSKFLKAIIRLPVPIQRMMKAKPCVLEILKIEKGILVITSVEEYKK